MTEQDRAAIREAVRKLPPFTEDEIQEMSEIILNARTHRNRSSTTHP